MSTHHTQVGQWPANRLLARGCVSIVSARRGRLHATVGDAGVWTVRLSRGRWSCDCPASGTCRHIQAVGKVAALPAGQRPRADW